MAEILAFRARPRLHREDQPIPADGARILFFLGVRYERFDATSERPKPAGGGKSASRGRRRRA